MKQEYKNIPISEVTANFYVPFSLEKKQKQKRKMRLYRKLLGLKIDEFCLFSSRRPKILKLKTIFIFFCFCTNTSEAFFCRFHFSKKKFKSTIFLKLFYSLVFGNVKIEQKKNSLFLRLFFFPQINQRKII